MPQPQEQLDKVLALADSAHEAEATAAVRKARQMLSRDGLNFSDLARAASHKPPMNRSFSSFFSGAQTHLENEIVRLKRKLQDVQTDLKSQSMQLEFWRQRATEMEQEFYAARSETERWRQLARDTVEKLWDLGQEARTAEAQTSPPAAENPPPKTA